MAALPLPTDSIQRRHFAQLAATLELPAPPEDSVLRRHYAQLFAARAERRMAKTTRPLTARGSEPDSRNMPPASAARASESPVRKAPPTNASAASVRTAPPAESRGLFSRLLAKLFG